MNIENSPITIGIIRKYGLKNVECSIFDNDIFNKTHREY